MRKRRANDLTRAGLESDEGGIPFLCECSSGDCYRTVWATAPEYDTAFAGSPLLAPGHAAAAPAPPA